MLWINIKRVFRSGIINFFRNGFVTLSSLLVMTITLFIISSMILLGGFFKYTLDNIKAKVDVNVYFVLNTTEPDILSIQKSLEALPEVENVIYLSKDDALANFKEKHKADELTLQALNELGENPLGAVLNIKAKDPSQYEGIAEFLKGSSVLSKDGHNIIDKVNYQQNKIVIDRLSSIISSANIIGIWLAIIFIIISILITFNTIRLTIFMAKDEISVMRLVGASSRYVKGPFMVSGILCGVISAIVILLFFALATFWMNHSYSQYFAGFNIFQYYISNLLWIVFSILGSGVVFGSIASYLAVRKYLRE
ncbi:MAG: permease-like cell division protein FtsX [Candidatus Paceibacterota bacterium]